jgi:hypothetical protein
MGQYYYPIILDENGNIVVWMDAHEYVNGLKLTEHSFIENNFVSTFEFGLSPEGIYHKYRVVWAGDYADNELNQSKNLYHLCNEYKCIHPKVKETNNYKFIVNHTKKQFVNKSKVPEKDGYRLHPLPILTAEGNGRGGGDYHSDSSLIGSWARDIISVEENEPVDFEEVIFDLVE